jgi:hypothetical protein
VVTVEAVVDGERLSTVHKDSNIIAQDGPASYDECSTQESMLDVKLEGGVHLPRLRARYSLAFLTYA